MAVAPKERLEVLFDELAELSGQRNAIDARIVEIAAELERDRLIGMTGARSLAALVARKPGYHCSARITTGYTTAARSPSPETPTTSPSPTAPAKHSAPPH